MERKPYPSEEAYKFLVRMPAGMRDQIAEEAALNRRSMNAQIVFMLQEKLPRKIRVVTTEHTEKIASHWSTRPSTPTWGNWANDKQVVGAPVPVTIRELAERLKMDVSGCRRYVLKAGYKPVRQRTASSGYQIALTLTAAEADEIQRARAAEGYCDAP